ncbi:hypothetical protein pb186bvf_015487 [Paramecium bursaria]
MIMIQQIKSNIMYNIIQLLQGIQSFIWLQELKLFYCYINQFLYKIIQVLDMVLSLICLQEFKLFTTIFQNNSFFHMLLLFQFLQYTTSPNLVIKPKKSILSLGQNTPKKQHKKCKLVPLLKWDELIQQFKFCTDSQKYKQLFRTGPTAFIIYVHQRSEYHPTFYQKLNQDRKIPMIDPNTKRGLYIWNYVIQLEQKNVQVYQLQCVINEEQQKQFLRQNNKTYEETYNIDQMLVIIAHALASQIVLIIENSNGFFHHLDQLQENNKYKIINLQTKKDKLEIPLNHYELLELVNTEQQAIQTQEKIQEWALSLQITIQKKQFMNVDLDFVTYLGLLQQISKYKLKQIQEPEFVNQIFRKAFDVQLNIGKKNCIENYKAQIQEFCSDCEQRQLNNILQFLNQLRQNIILQFYNQMYQFRYLDHYQLYLDELKVTIEENEQYCIKFYQEVFKNENDLQMTLLIQKCFQANNKPYPEQFMDFLNQLYAQKENKGIKYHNLYDFCQQILPTKIRNYLFAQNEEIKKQHERDSQTLSQQLKESMAKRDQMLYQQIKMIKDYNQIVQQEIQELQKQLQINQSISKDLVIINEIKQRDQQITLLQSQIQNLQI